MITKNEISSLNLSPTKKDFVQIWNELIEVASKITERWDPTSTNESDPGIVLLKALTGIADKLNYNIDKNILEAYMPTAAQMESMRKLCELVGYDIKYYQSAETKVRISYTGDVNDEEAEFPVTGLAIPKFTTITNASKDITFVTTNTIDALITKATPWVEVPCIEGQISQCESTNEYNLITLAQLDDNNRYYLPEVQIAENGIFVYNAHTIATGTDATLIDGTPWTRVSNLNTQSSETRVFKFGYDSFEGRPYLAFPSDVGSLIGDGLFIYFIRTSGLNGNISARTLEVLELPTGKSWEGFSAEDFEVVNVDSTTNGANIESITAAYNNFKRTIGTFDTLVTCRDYMNKIYSLMNMSNVPYVSNILVTDIRNDINNAITLCSCNEFGILYKETPLTKTVPGIASSITVNDDVPGVEGISRLVINSAPVTISEEPLIDHFDLRLYPFKTFTQVSAGEKDLVTPYNESFTYTEHMNREIEAALADLKTCAHKLTTPVEGDLVAINNYLRLNALIATSMKVSESEAKTILTNVKVALVNAFNMRNLDFGEEIPFDSILSVIENADSRIKAVSLQEPTVLTTYSVKEQSSDGATSREYGIVSTIDTTTGEKAMVSGVQYGVGSADDPVTNEEKAKDIYNKLVLRNILAGRASLFDYDETFIANNSEKPYTITHAVIESAKAILNNQESTKEEKATAQVVIDRINSAVKEALDAHKDTNNKVVPGEYILPGVAGLYEGMITLEVIDDTNYTPYETYTPDVAKNEIIDNVTRVEATCEIESTTNTFKNVTLGKNEVIKFRAPNLITTKTFPAYVYYRFELDDHYKVSSEGGSSANANGSFAQAMTLIDFINQENVGVKNFFESLWSADNAGIDFNHKDYVFDAELSDPDNPKIPDSTKLSNIFKSAIAIEADTQLQVKKRDSETNLPVEPVQYENYNTKIFISESEFSRVLGEHFSNSTNKTAIKFRYYPLTYHTSSVWSKCIRGLDSKLPAGTVLWQLSSTSSHPKGKFVLESGKKLIGLNGDSLALGSVGELVYVCTYLGETPNYSVMPDGSSIALGANARLFIHYTPSSTNEDGETVTAEPISVVYEGGGEDPLIVKPSGFTLMPSDDVNRQSTSWRKTDVEFVGYGKRNLLALAPNEQIELRSISKVVLDASAKFARFYKNFDNTELETGNINRVIEYELRDGEYLFYTDANTQEAAYYGSGSVITLEKGAFIPRAKEKVEVSQIFEHGLHKVPWSNYVTLTDEKKITITEYQYRTLVEGDTLKTLTVDTAEGSGGGSIGKGWVKCLSTEDNPISYISAGSESSETLPVIDLNSGEHTSWEVCSFLELSTSPGYAQPLRMSSVTSPSSNAEARSGNTSEALTIKDKIKVYSDKGSGVESIMTIEPESAEDPISIKLSTIAQSASGNFKKVDSDPEDAIDDTKMQLKIFREEAPTLIELNNLDETVTPISNKSFKPIDPSTTVLNNYWTKLELATLFRANPEYKETENAEPTTESVQEILPNALKLNFMIPGSDSFGIFSVYVEAPENKLSEHNSDMLSNGSRVFIDIPQEFGSYQDTLSIFNYSSTVGDQTYTWWPEGIDMTKTNRLYLRAGLNCIKVAKSCSILIKAEYDALGSLIYDNMRLVKGKETSGVNLQLLDPGATFNMENSLAKKDSEAKKTLADRVLKNIREIDKHYDFYYNVPVENSLAIEFDKNINSFSDPHTLYDINNINNDFVISKLDVKYLKDGLKIAKSSKY